MAYSPVAACRKCVFAVRDGGDIRCRRYPPMLEGSSTSTRVGPVAFQRVTYVNPAVAADHWCGEYQGSLERGSL